MKRLNSMFSVLLAVLSVSLLPQLRQGPTVRLSLTSRPLASEPAVNLERSATSYVAGSSSTSCRCGRVGVGDECSRVPSRATASDNLQELRGGSHHKQAVAYPNERSTLKTAAPRRIFFPLRAGTWIPATPVVLDVCKPSARCTPLHLRRGQTRGQRHTDHSVKRTIGFPYSLVTRTSNQRRALDRARRGGLAYSRFL